MIVYVFNNYFPDTTGFGRRCEREIAALSQIDEVTVICRQRTGESLTGSIKLGLKHINIIRFGAKSQVVKKPDNYKSNGLYEVKRNLDVMLSLSFTLIRFFFSNKDSKRLYSVTSPLTIPLLCLFVSKFFGVKTELVSFHDLEPELAMHMKSLSKENWIVKIEFLLEWIVCKGYEKVLVTTEGQAETLIFRTNISKSKICVIPNSTNLNTSYKSHYKSRLATAKDFLVVYMSAISFGYTVDGFKKFLNEVKKLEHFDNLKIIVLGGGDALTDLRNFISKNDLNDIVVCLGHIENPISYLKQADAAIVPWEKDIMTETMLPTKLFEYLSLKLPVIAPNFGEFKRILKNKKNVLLFNSWNESIKLIELLNEDERLRKLISENAYKLFNLRFQPKILDKKYIDFSRT